METHAKKTPANKKNLLAVSWQTTASPWAHARFCILLFLTADLDNLSAKSLSAGKLDFPSMIAKSSLNTKTYYYIIIIISEAQFLYAYTIYWQLMLNTKQWQQVRWVQVKLKNGLYNADYIYNCLFKLIDQVDLWVFNDF